MNFKIFVVAKTRKLKSEIIHILQFFSKGLQTAILPQVALLFHTDRHTYILTWSLLDTHDTYRIFFLIIANTILY